MKRKLGRVKLKIDGRSRIYVKGQFQKAMLHTEAGMGLQVLGKNGDGKL